MGQVEELNKQASILIGQIDRWRSETVAYRWLNILLFMSCKIFIPGGSLIVAANLTATLFSVPFIGNIPSTVIATIVTVLAGLEVMLNPSGKKRIAFTLNNELRQLKNSILIELASGDNETIKSTLIDSNRKLKDLLNNYSENGY